MKLSIIIVNYNTPRLLAECLRSVYKQTLNINFEVIVVDNASADNSRQLITTEFPLAIWVQMTYNAGFARANNEGIRRSSGDVILLLNSDTLNENNAIERCFLVFSQSHYIACGVQLLNADRTPQISGNYFMRGGLNNLLPLPYTGALIKWIGSVAKIKKPHVPDAGEPIEVDWINGAFLMIKKEAMEKVGLMDEDFFLYAEEAEWCYRLGKYGKMLIYGQFKILHLQGESSNAAFKSTGKGYYNLYDKKGLQIMLSNFVRIRKQFGAGWLLFHLIVYTLTIPAYFIANLFSVFSKGNNLSKNTVLAFKFSHNVMKLWRYVFVILKNRPFFYKVL